MHYADVRSLILFFLCNSICFFLSETCQKWLPFFLNWVLFWEMREWSAFVKHKLPFSSLNSEIIFAPVYSYWFSAFIYLNIFFIIFFFIIFFFIVFRDNLDNLVELPSIKLLDYLIYSFCHIESILSRLVSCATISVKLTFELTAETFHWKMGSSVFNVKAKNFFLLRLLSFSILFLFCNHFLHRTYHVR